MKVRSSLIILTLVLAKIIEREKKSANWSGWNLEEVLVVNSECDDGRVEKSMTLSFDEQTSTNR